MESHFPGSSACTCQIMGHLPFGNCDSQSPTLNRVSPDILLVLFLWRTLTPMVWSFGDGVTTYGGAAPAGSSGCKVVVVCSWFFPAQNLLAPLHKDPVNSKQEVGVLWWLFWMSLMHSFAQIVLAYGKNSKGAKGHVRKACPSCPLVSQLPTLKRETYVSFGCQLRGIFHVFTNIYFFLWFFPPKWNSIWREELAHCEQIFIDN